MAEEMTMRPQIRWCWVRAEDGIIGGVCLGLARQFNLSPWLVRALWLGSATFFGTGIFLYIMCLVSFPRSDRLGSRHEKVIMGVCARIGKRGDIDVGLARLIGLFLLVFSFPVTIVGYIVLYFVLTENQNKSLL